MIERLFPANAHDRYRRRIQQVNATVWLNISAGVW